MLIIVAIFAFINFRLVNFNTTGTLRLTYDGKVLTLSSTFSSLSLKEGDKLTLTYNGKTESIEEGTLTINPSSRGRVILTLPKEVEDLSIITTSADVELFPLTINTISITSESGDISITEANTEKLNLSTISGDIFIGKASSSLLKLSSESGNIEFNEADSDESEITTTSGEVSGYITSTNKTSITSKSGNIRVECASPSLYQVNVDTDSGIIDIPSKYNGNEHILLLTTTSGNITLL